MSVRTMVRALSVCVCLAVIGIGFASEPGLRAMRLTSQREVTRIDTARLQPEVTEVTSHALARDEGFAHARANAAAVGSARVIVELDVPNYKGLAAASGAARGAQAIGATDAQLTGAILPVRQAELAKLAGTAHNINRTYSTLPFVAMTVDVNALDRLRASRGIVAVTEDYRDTPNLDTTPAIVGAPVAWAAGYDGSGTYVAVLDTGIRATHNFFAGKTIVQACFSLGADGLPGAGDCPNGLSEDTTSPDAARHFLTSPNSDHGSHVTGIATGNDPGRVPPLYGIARGADIIAVQVFYQDPGGLFATVADQLAGLEYVYSLRLTHNIAAVNMSLGGGSFSDQAACDSANASRKVAIDNLRAAGIATVIASGNNGFCGSISGPGCVSSAIAVGNVNDADVEDGGSNFHDPMIDLFGQGVEVLSSIGFGSDSSYSSTGWTGTSMSSPHVAGAFAVLHQAAPGADVSTILAALQATGDPVSGHCTATPTARRIQIDLALELVLAGYPKIRQLPDNAGESIHSDVDLTDSAPNAVLADDFFSDGRPTHSVRWWGSNLSVGAAAATASAKASKTTRRTPPRITPEAYTEAQVAEMVAEKARISAANPQPPAAPGDEVLVGGDTCGTATVIAALPYNNSGNSCSGNNNYDSGVIGAECPFTGSTADDVVYSFTPGSNIDVEISLCGNSAYDTKLYVFTASCPSAIPVGWCDDDTCSTPSFASPFVSELPLLSLVGGTTYYIVVDGFGTGAASCGNYTISMLPLVCGDGILAGEEECDPPNGTTCNASCQSIVCGDGVVEGLEVCEPPNGITCDSACQPIANPPIDGWLVSFHEPLTTGGSAVEPLGLYFCDAAVVDVRAATLGACDALPVREYLVRLDDCCLLVANADTRTTNTPAQIDGFHDESCLTYDLDIQAVIGTKYFVTGGGPGVCDNSSSTGNSASIPFWAWHTAPADLGTRAALSSTVTPPGTDWLYGPWSNVTPTCAAPNMAFEILTDVPGAGDCNNNGTPDVCESGPDCQPNGIFDDCDIAAGTSLDCQPNSIPDECDLTGGAPDCQPDGIPDACQLAGNDDNANNIPDECDPTPPVAVPGPGMVRAIALRVAPVPGAAYSVDDGEAEDAIGVNSGGGPPGQAFGWANRFTNTTGGPISLLAVEVAFGTPLGGGGVAVGNRVDAVIWIDAAATGNMANATVAVQWALPGGVHANDATFAMHSIPGGELVIPTGADFYVGMGDVQTSLDSLVRFPASIDQTPPTQNRSWAFLHNTLNIFDPVNLGTQTIGTIEALSGGSISGNWLVRARISSPGSPTALRVMPLDLQNPVPPNPSSTPPDFSAYESATCSAPGEGNACGRWVGPVVMAFEAQDNLGLGTYKAARLQCTPYYNVWSPEGVIHVLGAEILPSSTYDVVSVASSCAGSELTCPSVSLPLSRATTRWGDLTTPYAPSGVQPDPLDIVGVLNRYKSQAGSPLHASSAIQPNMVDMNVDVSPLDVVATIDAYKGFAYPYTGPCPCPSAVTCNTVPCSTSASCSGGVCIRSCSGGSANGQPCTNNNHCAGGGVCPVQGFCRDRCGRCFTP